VDKVVAGWGGGDGVGNMGCLKSAENSYRQQDTRIQFAVSGNGKKKNTWGRPASRVKKRKKFHQSLEGQQGSPNRKWNGRN